MPIVHRALVAQMEGRLADMDREVSEAMIFGQRLNDQNMLSAGAVQRILLLIEQGRASEALGGLESWVAACPTLPAWRCLLVHALVKAGAGERARCVFRGLEENAFALPSDMTWLAAMAWLAEAAAALNEPRAAKLLYDRLAPYEGHCVVVGAAVAFLGSVHHYLGRLAGAMLEWDLAVDHCERARRLHASMEAKVLYARSCREHALALAARAEARAEKSTNRQSGVKTPDVSRR